MDDLRLSALIGTRLCHDLIGPAGAVMNGVELLAEDEGGLDREVIDLIQHSANETTRRLKFFRIAWGVPAEGQTIAQTRALADDYFSVSKITLAWQDSLVASAPPTAMMPVILNLILCAAEALPRGGRITIDGAPSADGFSVRIEATGETIKIDDEARLSLSGDREIASLEARGIAPYMAARLAAAAGGRIEVYAAAESMKYSVKLPITS